MGENADMNDKQFTYFLRKTLPVLALVLLLCLITRIVFAGVYASEKKAQSEHPQDTSGEAQSSNPTEDSNSGANGSESNGVSESETNKDDTDIILKSTSDAGQEYIDKIVFLGDSTTYGLSYYGIVKENQVWTGAGSNGGTNGTLTLDSTINTRKIYYPDDDSALTIAQAVAKKKPEYLIITLGINGGVASYFEEKQFKASYRKVIEAVKENSPETVMILQNIFPVASNVNNEEYPKITNQNIDTANGWVKDIAKEYGLKYLDSQECLRGIDGYMQSSYQSGDGIHMTPAALRVLINYIRTHAYDLQ